MHPVPPQCRVPAPSRHKAPPQGACSQLRSPGAPQICGNAGGGDGSSAPHGGDPCATLAWGSPLMHLFAPRQSPSHLLIDHSNAQSHHLLLHLPQGFPCCSRATAESIASLPQRPLGRPPRHLCPVQLASCAIGHCLRPLRLLRRRQDAAIRLCGCWRQRVAGTVATQPRSPCPVRLPPNPAAATVPRRIWRWEAVRLRPLSSRLSSASWLRCHTSACDS